MAAELATKKDRSDRRYYGAETSRARENFQATGVSLGAYPHFISALALVKKAAAGANLDLGALDDKAASAIIRACDEIIEGGLPDQFPLDILQGSDTSFNMNVNEVVATRATEILRSSGNEKCAVVHPNDHVNLSQSTNDVVHTAMRIATINLSRGLCGVLKQMEDALQRKSEEFADVVKIGRTCLQDAVPMTLGQEFEGYASIVAMMRESIEEEDARLTEVNLGGTAVGTGFATPGGYQCTVLRRLSEFSGHSLRAPRSLFGATQNDEGLAILSGKLKTLAVSLSKIAGDLSLLSSGPQAGLREIGLPTLQAGSSMMPGKVNPVVPMFVNQVAYIVTGYDVALSMAVEGGQLDLNANGAAIAYCLLESFKLLTNAVNIFTHRCIGGITANREVCLTYARGSVGLATALKPLLGYKTAAAVAEEALTTDKTVLEVVIERGLLDDKTAVDILSPERLMGPGKTTPG